MERLGAWNKGLAELVSYQVERQPHSCAVRQSHTDQSLTYQQLWERSGQLAADLARRGVRRGEVVAVDLGRSVDLVVALLGVVRVGGAYLPLDMHGPPDRRSVILEEAGVRFVLSTEDVRDESLETHADVFAAVGDPCYVNFTSGSTGRPKGVLVPHRAVVRLVTNPVFCSIDPGDRVANCANPAFDATTFELWNTLTAGGTVVVFPSVTDLRLDDWIELVYSEGITTMFLTTSLFHMVARERPRAFRRLKTLVVGGEQMDLAATRRVLAEGPPGRLVNGYGPTETITFATYYDCTPDSLAGLDRVPVGFALQDTRVHVLDEELNPVAPGDTGELCVGGPAVALGYVNRPELTRERFVPEPGMPGALMYRTGDLARTLPNGALELLGRRDRQVKLRGFRIELEEVERAVLSTGVVDSAFVEKIGEGVSAYLACLVLPRPSADVDALPRTLGEALAHSLPDYMIPTRWHVLAELPYGATGKVDRRKLLAVLREPAVESHSTSDVSEAAHETPPYVTQQVQLVWCEVLGVPKAEPTENFVESGGNSILAIQLASRLRERLAVDVEPTDVLLAETLADLVDHVSTK